MQRCAALRHDSFRFDSIRFCSARSATATATTAPTRAKTPPSRTAESQTRHAVGRSAVQRRTETPLPFTHHRTRQTRLALTTSSGNTQIRANNSNGLLCCIKSTYPRRSATTGLAAEAKSSDRDLHFIEQLTSPH